MIGAQDRIIQRPYPLNGPIPRDRVFRLPGRLGDRTRAAAFIACYNRDIRRLPTLDRLAQLSESILDGTQSGELNTGATHHGRERNMWLMPILESYMETQVGGNRKEVEARRLPSVRAAQQRPDAILAGDHARRMVRRI